MNQQNLRGSIKLFILLVCAGSLAYFSVSLFGQSQQMEELKQANQLLEEQQYNSAITIYDHLLAKNTEASYSILINRGYAFKGLKQYENMLQSCSRATSLAPQFGFAWNCQGEAFYYLEQYKDALKALGKAIAVEPSEVTFWLNKARILSDLQQYNEAVAASSRAMELSDRFDKENKAIALKLKGENLLKIAKYQESLATFTELLSLKPTWVSAQQGKGIALYELGKYDMAIATWQEILKSDSITDTQHSTSWLYLGASFCQMGKIAAAERAFQEVLLLTTEPASRTMASKGCGIS